MPTSAAGTGEIDVKTIGGGSLTNTGRLEAENSGGLRINNLMGNLGDAIVKTGGKLIVEGGVYTVDKTIELADANTSVALGGTYTVEQPLNQSGEEYGRWR